MKQGKTQFTSWMLDEDGTLTIAPIDDTNNHITSWNEYKNMITKVIVEEGIKWIDSCAFENCKNLKSIKLPESIISIGNHAFSHCEHLEDINIPININLIEEYTFLACNSLKTINIPNHIKEIENSVFQDCINLQEIVIPDSVEKIGSMAFYNCTSLKRLVVGKSLEYGLNGMIFSNNHLSEIVVDKDNPYYESINHVVYSKNVSQSILLYPSQKQDKSYTILEGTLRIGDRTFFQNPYIKQIYIPSSIKHIGVSAFYCQNLKDIYFNGTKQQWENTGIQWILMGDIKIPTIHFKGEN